MQSDFFLFQGPEHKNVCLWASGFFEPRFVICFTQSSWSWWSSSAKAKSCSIIIEIILIIYLLSIVPNEQNEYRFSFFIDICMASSKFERLITFMAKRLFDSLKIWFAFELLIIFRSNRLFYQVHIFALLGQLEVWPPDYLQGHLKIWPPDYLQGHLGTEERGGKVEVGAWQALIPSSYLRLVFYCDIGTDPRSSLLI